MLWLLIAALCAPSAEADAWCGKGWHFVKALGGCAKANTDAPTPLPTPAPTPPPPTPHPTPVWTTPAPGHWTPPPQATMHPTPLPTPLPRVTMAPTPQQTWQLQGGGLVDHHLKIEDQMAGITNTLSHHRATKSTMKRLWDTLTGMGKAEDAAAAHKKQQRRMRREQRHTAYEQRYGGGTAQKESELQKLRAQAAALRAKALRGAPRAAGQVPVASPSSLDGLRQMRKKLLAKKAAMRAQVLRSKADAALPAAKPSSFLLGSAPGTEVAALPGGAPGIVINAPPGDAAAAVTVVDTPPVSGGETTNVAGPPGSG